jgi:hypothetical protein
MVIKSALKALGILFLFTTLASLTVGCATTGAGRDNYSSDQDAQAVQEMEWNLDPWR